MTNKKAVKEEGKTEAKVFQNIADIAAKLALEKPPSQKPNTFTGILLSDKVERTDRGIRLFIKTDDNHEYFVNVSKHDVIDLYENKFFGKKVTATKSEEGRSWTIELA